MNDFNSNNELNNFQKSEKIEKMFDEISSQYDFLNNIISFFTHYSIKKKSLDLLKLKPNSKILDLCCGSGDLGEILLKKYPNSKITGVDFSQKMLDIAKKRNKKIEYFKMDAQNLDFQDNSFDCVVMGFGLRNIEDKELCLKEIYRILKPGGVFLQLDFGKKNLVCKIYNFIILFLINFLKNKKAYKYLINSKNKFDEPEELIKKFKKTGFKNPLVRYFCFKNISAQICAKMN